MEMAMQIYFFIFITFVTLNIITCSSPPKVKFIMRNKGFKRDSEFSSIYRNHYKQENERVMRDEGRTMYHTKSDSMQLYSIAAKRSVLVQDKVGVPVWDHEYELSVTGRSRKYGKENKFVTETVSYGKLKIRAEDNNQYICAKNNGEIVFKDVEKMSPNSKKQHDFTKSGYRRNRKTRKRCLFTWSFTNQMHIKLSVATSRGKTWYLAVKNDVVILTQSEDTTELEKSFIWLPAKSGKPRGKTLMQYSRPTRPNQRSFDTISNKNTCKKVAEDLEAEKLKYKNLKNRCVMAATRNALQKEKIQIMKDELNDLKEENVALKRENDKLKKASKEIVSRT